MLLLHVVCILVRLGSLKLCLYVSQMLNVRSLQITLLHNAGFENQSVIILSFLWYWCVCNLGWYRLVFSLSTNRQNAKADVDKALHQFEHTYSSPCWVYMVPTLSPNESKSYFGVIGSKIFTLIIWTYTHTNRRPWRIYFMGNKFKKIILSTVMHACRLSGKGLCWQYWQQWPCRYQPYSILYPIHLTHCSDVYE